MRYLEQREVHVLLVEDDAADRDLAKLALAKCETTRFDIRLAESLSQAMELVRSHRFDALLLDLGLPESSGLQTLDRIRRLDEEIPIVVLTDLSDQQAALDSLDKGAQDYLLKSDVTVDSLSRSICYAIQRQQLLSELSAANQLLQQKNERLTSLCDTAQKFVDNVSHEFRTPLTVIKEYVSLLQDGVVGSNQLDAEQCRFLDIVADRADDLNTMVDDLLDVSKLEAGLLGVWRKGCHISDIVDPLRATLEKKAEVKGVELLLDCEQPLPEVYCDAEKVGRVITNLAINAIKFCREPGRVKIWARNEPARYEVVVGVTDNGPGIDAASLDVIFERFRQLEDQPRGSCKGFGLGLNVARELIDLNLGELRVESQLGVGSTFSFSVPCAVPGEVAARYLRRMQHMRSGSPFVSLLDVRVPLWVEDELADHIDAVLNYLRGDDLLFRCGTHQWLLVLPTAECELDEYIDRAETVIRDADGNRPESPLPEVDVTVVGTWAVADHGEQILQRICGILEPVETV